MELLRSQKKPVFSGATVLFCFPDAEKSCSALMLMARTARSHRLGPLHPSFNLLQMVKDSLLSSLPEDAHRRVSGRLCVSLTRVADGKNVLVSEFRSRDELVEVQSPRVQAYLSHASLPEDRSLTCPSDIIVFSPGPHMQLLRPALLWRGSAHLPGRGESKAVPA